MMLRGLTNSLRSWLPIAKRLFERITEYRYVKNKTMLENKHELPQPLIAAGAILAAGAAALGAFKYDQYLGNRNLVQSDQPEEPEIFSHPRPNATKTMVLLGGYCMGTRGVIKRFDSQVAEDVNTIAPITPDTGASPEAMYEGTYQELEKLDTQELFIVGLSLGGRRAIKFVRYGCETGREDMFANYSMEFRGTPMDKRAIRLKPRVLLDLIGFFKYGYTLNRIRPAFSQSDAKSVATAHIARVVGEGAELLEDFDSTLPVKPKRVVWVRGMEPDPTTNEDRSISKFQRANRIAVEQYFDPDCVEAKHMPTSKQAARYMLAKMGLAKPVEEPATIHELQPVTNITFRTQAA